MPFFEDQTDFVFSESDVPTGNGKFSCIDRSPALTTSPSYHFVLFATRSVSAYNPLDGCLLRFTDLLQSQSARVFLSTASSARSPN